MPLSMTPFDLAQRFVGEIHEEKEPGKDSRFIQWCLELVGFPENVSDEVPWCSAFANRIAWLLRLPRSKSAMARSWLTVGKPIDLTQAEPGYDVVILKRGTGLQPGPEILDAPGHVGFFAGIEKTPTSVVLVLAGNQGDTVSIQRFPAASVLGVRRLV